VKGGKLHLGRAQRAAGRVHAEMQHRPQGRIDRHARGLRIQTDMPARVLRQGYLAAHGKRRFRAKQHQIPQFDPQAGQIAACCPADLKAPALPRGLRRGPGFARAQGLVGASAAECDAQKAQPRLCVAHRVADQFHLGAAG
jgi:hypothetical protein